MTYPGESAKDLRELTGQEQEANPAIMFIEKALGLLENGRKISIMAHHFSRKELADAILKYKDAKLYWQSDGQTLVLSVGQALTLFS